MGEATRHARTRIVTLGVLGLAGVVQAAPRPWAALSGSSDGAVRPTGSVLELASESGTAPGAILIAGLGLVCWAGVLMLRGRVRTVSAWLAGGDSLVLLGFVLSEFVRAPERVESAREDFALPVEFTGEVALTGWYWLAVVAALAACAASAVAIRQVGVWPEMGRKYDAPATAVVREPSDPADEQALWKALSEGRDPTA